MKPAHPFCAIALLLAGAASAQDRAELERTPIVGNRELPKVLYIVPWKKPTAPPLAARPAGGVLDEAPAALDRDVLRRQLRLDAGLRARTDPDNNPTGVKR
jgi:hypothetical protein